jgi:hypothetical protein
MPYIKMTVKQVIDNLRNLGDAYEQVANNGRPVMVPAVHAAALVRCAEKLISETQWHSVDDCLPQAGEPVLAYSILSDEPYECEVSGLQPGVWVQRWTERVIFKPDYWCKMPAPPGVTI